jgi:hypothetical protein
MKYLCVGEEYEANGEKKVAWKQIGETFTGKNGKEYAKIYHIPNTLIHVFEADKPKDESGFTDDAIS